MKTVDDLIDDVLRREGGYVNHPADKGGPTKYGITQATLGQWLGRAVGADEVRALEEGTAREIYEQRYFHAPRIAALPEIVQPILFDIAVNSGPKRAVAMLQSVINQAGFGPVDTDGVAGPQTRTAAQTAADEMGAYLVNALVEERRAFFASIIAANASQAVFERGWMARAEEFRVEVA